MPRGQLFINEKDAFLTWGISLDSSALSALLTPPAKKAWVTNEVRTDNGTKYALSAVPPNSQREFTLTITLTAEDEEQFFARYASFCEELSDGTLEIRTSFHPSVVYRCVYMQCSQFSQFRQQMAFFSLKLIEPNTTDRNL